MSEKKVRIPQEMLDAAWDAAKHVTKSACADPRKVGLRKGLEAALRWLSKNPIVPTIEQIQEMKRDLRYREGVDFDTLKLCGAWQRQMFLASEPEVPEAIKDLLIEIRNMDEAHGPAPVTSTFFNISLMEAFRRGQQSK